MDDFIKASEQISLFCRMNNQIKPNLPIRASEMGMLIYLVKTDEEKTPLGVANFFSFHKIDGNQHGDLLIFKRISPKKAV
ncbi:MarR family transcriptional regulator [Listeria floridensis FSL S10-1187]|uniref:MarR family transcriptional regulator n=1 Tax=Listeria floridensis FSL S10-1187 TaxID=1265817 RepID=A0ABN0RFT6_9LIST|nr:hypothetical protein [Listeria floridensis]EUJ32435.1 MarR family transcriptional regulator [Listeria floridensis FSL S10-1187]